MRVRRQRRERRRSRRKLRAKLLQGSRAHSCRGGITFVPCIDERWPRRGSHGSEQTFCERGIISSRGILSSSFDFGQTASSTTSNNHKVKNHFVRSEPQISQGIERETSGARGD